MKKIWMTGIAVSALLALPAYALNPQPEPPGKNRVTHHIHSNATTFGHETPGSKVLFNPQPDPPGKLHTNAMDSQSGLPTGRSNTMMMSGGTMSAHKLPPGPCVTGSASAQCHNTMTGSGTQSYPGGGGSGKTH